MAKTGKKLILPIEDSFETVREIGSYVQNESAQFSKGLTSDVLNSFLYGPSSSSESSHSESGTHTKREISAEQKSAEVDVFLASQHLTGVEASSMDRRRMAHAEAYIEPGLMYHADILRSGDKGIQRENAEINQLTSELTAELKNLVKSSNELKMQFASLDVEQSSAEQGKYHVHLISWLIAAVRTMSMKISEGSSWLGAIQSKNGKKGNFINDMWKKGNTSVTMSNERSMATSVG